MTYRVELRPPARRYLGKLPTITQGRIIRRLETLEADPRPRWTKPLHRDLAGRRSFRVGGCRVIYRVEDDVLLVLVIEIGPRGRVYDDVGRRTE